MASALADRYTIERELGQGGMATVYLAQDLKHERQVAVKVLREDLTASLGGGRFLREIKIAAQLQHPNILPLLDSGEADGFLFYVMPFVAGQSLRERLAREGELPVHEAVRLIIEVVDALAHAHEHGVVHRDIKPDNVMLSGRHALVTDFGVAKAISEATGRNTVTTLGVAVGTPTYMSPEQAAADPHIDHRSDIYAVGVMAYELLTGQPPFTGATPQSVLAAHVTQAPDPVGNRRPGMPAGLDAVIMRCLAKRPADRWQTADELHNALEVFATPSTGITPTQTRPTSTVGGNRRMLWAAGAAVVLLAATFGILRARRGGSVNTTAHAIAVLPFDNTSGDSALDYLADGIADDLRSGIKAAMPAMSVKARTSSARAKGRTIHEVAAMLGVDLVLQGTVRRASDSTTITVDLVTVTDETSLWSGKFVRPTGANLAAVQDSITTAIAAALHYHRAADATDVLAQRGTRDEQAYTYFLQGIFRFRQFDFDGTIGYLKQAVARDPDFARAHAWLAIGYAYMALGGIGSPDSTLDLAKASVERAATLDATLVDVKRARASILIMQMQYSEAERTLAELAKADSDNVDLRWDHAIALGLCGRVGEALAELQLATKLDPFNTALLTATQYFLYAIGRNRDAIDVTRRLLQLDPGSVAGYGNLGLAYIFAGQPDSAVRAMEQAVALDSTAFGGRTFTMLGYAAAGRWPDAEREREAILRQPFNSPDFLRAMAGIAFGAYDSAAAAVARSVDHREPMLNGYAWSCEPLFDPIKTHPAFIAAAKQVGAAICPAVGTWPFPIRRH
ncbi:MAG: protein kinase [Gemmatimonadota bacterium]